MNKLSSKKYHQNVDEINDIQNMTDCRYKYLYNDNDGYFNDLTDVVCFGASPYFFGLH